MDAIKSYLYRENTKKDIFKIAAIWTFIFSMAANAFAYFNLIPQHDSLNHLYTYSTNWEISLGRFILPLIGKLRGSVSIPWVEGMFSMLFIFLTVYLVSQILELDKTYQIVIVSAVLSANICLTELTSVFMYVDASYMFAIFLATLSVYLAVCRTKLWEYVLAVVCMIISLGTYQAEIIFVAVLLMLRIIKDCLINVEIKTQLLKWVRWAGIYFVSLIAYFAVYKLVLKVLNIIPADDKRGLSSLSIENLAKYKKSFLILYNQMMSFFFGDSSLIGKLFKYCNWAILIVLILLFGMFLFSKRKWYNKILIMIMIAAIPAITITMDVLLLDEELEFYVANAIPLIYIVPLLLSEEIEMKIFKKVIPVNSILCVLMAALTFTNVIFSNAVYSDQKVRYDKTLSVMTIVCSDIINVEGFNIETTPIYLKGNVNENIYLTDYFDLSSLSGGSKGSTTYEMTAKSYMRNIMGYDFVYCDDDSLRKSIRKSEEYKAMPYYPNNGYIRMIDGVLVVKLSKK